ncbi:MAG TPA: penicillin acylase family protein [Vicinamibacteria bacterium]|nr:penicillin acylase family protein [Vicinamibacteria bacterium]
MNVLFALLALSPLATAEPLSLAGLHQPVEILTDRWGVAHIYAQNEHDLFFAQGYNAARDRLFQFEMWRRQATGTVAEILGRRELERDIGTRLHQFRKDLDQELNHYHPRGKAIIEAFVEGINASVDEALAEPARLPIEFQLLGIEPGRWTAADVISRHQGLLSNVTSELRTARAVHAIGADKVRELEWYRPGQPELELDPTIDGSLLKDEILELYRAFRGPVEFLPEDIVVEHRADARSHERFQDKMLRALPVGDGSDDIGSNNWVVSGRFTHTGFPYIVNDPHRVLAVPSLRYFVHLVAPGWNVIGGGEPVLPGISIGHNEYGGWGLTVFGQDNEDLYVYDTNPRDPNQYRYLDGWEEMRILRETIPIKGESPETVELKYTRHGPVLFEDREHHKAYALRAAWMEIGNSPYLASLRMNQAKSWEEFVEACSYSRIPAENMIWGDVDKNIGYQAVGISPIRPNWSGLVPVPGDGRYEWDGFLPIIALPRVKNPEKGYWGTANNFMVPDGYPYPEALHWTWGDEMRGLRVDELLSSGRRFTIVDMMSFQHDELSIPARSLVPLLKELQLDDSRSQQARDLLLGWDFVVDKPSVAAAIYVSFERRLLDEVATTVVPGPARELIGRLNKKRVIDWLVAPDGRFGEDPIAGRDAVLKASLAGAVSDLTERLGPDTKTWQYGQEKFKHVAIQHALSPAVDVATRAKLDVGPAPRGGYDSTLNNTGSGDNQTSGATFRVILDASDWDNSIATNAPGQSGNPDDPHYRDLFELWAKHQYFPLFYTREKIESVTESRLELLPVGATDR